jgi:hypothetical protein
MTITRGYSYFSILQEHGYEIMKQIAVFKELSGVILESQAHY